MARAAPARDQTVPGQHTSRGSTRARAAARRGWRSDQRSRRPTTRRYSATTAGCGGPRSRCSSGSPSTGGQRRPLPVGTRFADAAPRLPHHPHSAALAPEQVVAPMPVVLAERDRITKYIERHLRCGCGKHLRFSKAASHQVRFRRAALAQPCHHRHPAPHTARSARVHRGNSCARSRARSRRFSRHRCCMATTTRSTPSCTMAWSPARSPTRARSRFSRCSA